MACSANCGITRVREREKRAAFALAERLYPRLVWTPDLQPATSPVSFDTIVGLGHQLEQLLPVRSMARPGGVGEADALYLLAGLHEPALCEVANGARVDAAWEPAFRSETYLRVVLSPFDRFATIQEVRVEASRVPVQGPSIDGAGDLEIAEEPVAGVVDTRLRSIVKGLQGALKKAGLTLLDMALLLEKLECGPQAAFLAVYQEEPTLWSLLFDPAPATTKRVSLVRLRPSARGGTYSEQV